ncbi:MAG: formate/nitrite transporter family protein [Methanoregulaceae archaeon]|jgi:formate/nitrite transporter
MVFHPPVAIVAKAGDAGKYKTGLPIWNMLMRGFMAGAYIAMGGALASVCSTGIAASAAAIKDAPGLAFGVSSAGFAQLILGAVFPVGLIIIVLTGAELFTGDAMLAPMAAFIHKISWVQVLNLWVWVYIGNLIGSICWAYIMANGPFVSFGVDAATGVTTATITAFGTRAIAIAAAKTSYVGMLGMWSAFLKGIGCNWLVNLAILLGICADDAAGKFFGIWFPIMAFVSMGLEHSIANMYFIPAGIMTAGITNTATTVTWINMWTANLIPVTLGNIVGGMFFVGIIYWVAFRKEIAALK